MVYVVVYRRPQLLYGTRKASMCSVSHSFSYVRVLLPHDSVEQPRVKTPPTLDNDSRLHCQKSISYSTVSTIASMATDDISHTLRSTLLTVTKCSCQECGNHNGHDWLTVVEGEAAKRPSVLSPILLSPSEASSVCSICVTFTPVRDGRKSNKRVTGKRRNFSG